MVAGLFLIISKVKINITKESIVVKSPTYCLEISLSEFKIVICFMIFRHRVVVCFWSEKAARQVIISVISKLIQSWRVIQGPPTTIFGKISVRKTI